MSPQKSKARDMLEFLALFAILYLLVQFSLRHFFPDKFGAPQEERSGVVLSVQDKTVKSGHHPMLTLQNYNDTALMLEERCPMPPVTVSRLEGDGFTELSTEENALPCESLTEVLPGESATIDLAPWKYSLFGENGTYLVKLPIMEDADDSEDTEEAEDSSDVLSAQFEIYEAGFITQMFRSFVTKPLLNLLILIASFTPKYNLGIAIILLTILVKLVLYFPTQKGLEGQRRLQQVQPKLDALKAKYKDEPQRFQQETMKIWKEYKINPFASCMPILIQFPVLIGLFFVIRDGVILELSRHLLYSPYQDLSWTFGTSFLGLDLNTPNRYILPPLLMVLQFMQMKLTFAMAKKKQEAKQGDAKQAQKQSAQQMQQKMMQYGLPIMIGVFAIQFPAAVALYWGVSTVFAIGQQLVVNRKLA